MIGLLLAAGMGRRIEELTQGLPKSFLLLGGKRIIDHQIESLHRVGIKEIVIVTGYRSDLFERDYDMSGVVLVKNPFFDRTNVLPSVWFARDYLHKGFYFAHSDTYFEPSILQGLVREEGDIILAVNWKPTVPEDMKVRVKEGRVVRIDKEMDCELAQGEFTGLAKIGMKIASRVVERVQDRVENRGDHDHFFEVIIQDLIDQGVEVQSFDIGSRFSIEIDFPEDYEEAQRFFDGG